MVAAGSDKMKVRSVILKRTYARAPIDTNVSGHGDLADADNLDRSRTRRVQPSPLPIKHRTARLTATFRIGRG